MKHKYPSDTKNTRNLTTSSLSILLSYYSSHLYYNIVYQNIIFSNFMTLFYYLFLQFVIQLYVHNHILFQSLKDALTEHTVLRKGNNNKYSYIDIRSIKKLIKFSAYMLVQVVILFIYKYKLYFLF